MLCLRASFNLSIVVRGAAARYGCVMDYFTPDLVSMERDPWPPDDGPTVVAWDTESTAIRGFFCLTDTLRPSSPVEQVKVRTETRRVNWTSGFGLKASKASWRQRPVEPA
jgi:hypothetical protein